MPPRTWSGDANSWRTALAPAPVSENRSTSVSPKEVSAPNTDDVRIVVGISAMNSFDDSASPRSSGSTMMNRSMILRASAIRSATRRFYDGGQQRYGRWSRPAVGEGCFIPAAPREGEPEMLVGGREQLGDDLTARLVVPGDHARYRTRVLERLADAHGDGAPGPEPAAPWCVVDLDPARDHLEQVAGLERPRELLERGAAQPAGVHVLKRTPLVSVRAFVQVQHPVPGRSWLVIAVPDHHHHAQAAYVEVADRPPFDPPRQRAGALAVRRSPTAAAVDPAAWADRVAVAGLEVGAAEAPGRGARLCLGGHRAILPHLATPGFHRWAGTGSSCDTRAPICLPWTGNSSCLPSCRPRPRSPQPGPSPTRSCRSWRRSRSR